jgi:hypothetical protein
VPALDVPVTSSTNVPVTKKIDKPYSDCSDVQNPGPIHDLLQMNGNDRIDCAVGCNNWLIQLH